MSSMSYDEEARVWSYRLSELQGEPSTHMRISDRTEISLDPATNEFMGFLIFLGKNNPVQDFRLGAVDVIEWLVEEINS